MSCGGASARGLCQWLNMAERTGLVVFDAGDNAGAAGSVAAEVGLAAADVHAGLLPEEKLDMVR